MGSQHATAGLPAAQEKLKCPLCGDDRITTHIHHHTFNYGSGESAVGLTVDLPVRRCASCDCEYLDEVAEDLKHEAICQHFGVLSPGEIRRVREHHHMTRARFAEVTGIGEASLNRWENGLTIQTYAYDKFLRLLAFPGIMQRLENLGTGRPTFQPASNTSEKRFRMLKVTEDIRTRQEGFQLRLVA